MVEPCAGAPIAIILAAGRSSRTAPAHKLLAKDAQGVPMLVRTTATVLASTVSKVVVILPPERPDLSSLISTAFPATPRLEFRIAQDAADGLSASLRVGIAAAQEAQASALLVCLGDMPLVSVTLLNALLRDHALFNAPATAPDRGDGKPGNPVVWNESHFSALAAVQGDQGGRAILRALGPAVHRILASANELVDFDTPERLAAYARSAPTPVDHMGARPEN
ncbi:nucleotidyltransferase family protein [Acetobacter persici]|nr:nucleotidyltransferase family protein [Acetobacter persici]